MKWTDGYRVGMHVEVFVAGADPTATKWHAARVVRHTATGLPWVQIGGTSLTLCVSRASEIRAYTEIAPEHVGKALFSAFGRQWPVSSFIGRILPQDVGKRVYLRDDVLQVENNEQLAKRLGAT